MVYQEQREMGISLDEFLRLLPTALKNTEYSQSDNRIYIAYAGGTIVIELSREYFRQIASLSLPVLKVEFVFNEIDQNDIVDFFSSFNRVYQRGGG